MENNQDEYRYPYIYYEIDPQRTVDLISELLVELVRRNDSNPTATAAITRFHSRAPPSIGIRDYLSRIVKYTPVENEVLLASLVYIDRLCEINPTFAITSLSVHRYLITAICVGSKVFCDSYCTNTHYAKVGGISVQELNTLELEFSFLANWKLVIPAQVIHSYYLGMLKESKTYHMIKYDTLETLPSPIVQPPTRQQLKASKIPIVESRAPVQNIPPNYPTNQQQPQYQVQQAPLNPSQQTVHHQRQLSHPQVQYQHPGQPQHAYHIHSNQHPPPHPHQYQTPAQHPPIHHQPQPVMQNLNHPNYYNNPQSHRPILIAHHKIHQHGQGQSNTASMGMDDDDPNSYNQTTMHNGNSKNRTSVAPSQS